MVRGFVVGACGAAVALAGATGCAINGPQRVGAPPSETIAPVARNVKVSIDERPQEIRGPVACTAGMGEVTIEVGEPATGIAVKLAQDASRVTSVGLGKFSGMLMGYHEGAPGATAVVTKVGNTYTITGTATGVRPANLAEPITTPFEIRVTCP